MPTLKCCLQGTILLCTRLQLLPWQLYSTLSAVQCNNIALRAAAYVQLSCDDGMCTSIHIHVRAHKLHTWGTLHELVTVASHGQWPCSDHANGHTGTTYSEFIKMMHLPSQLAHVDPIVASFCGGAVGVLSAFMVVEANNAKAQEKRRCQYCEVSMPQLRSTA